MIKTPGRTIQLWQFLASNYTAVISLTDWTAATAAAITIISVTQHCQQ